MHQPSRRIGAIALTFGLVVAACGSDSDGAATTTGSDQESIDNAEQGHGDGIEVPAGMTVPTIGVEIVSDPVAGQNLFVTLGDFTVAPEHASADPVDGQGHLHLYVDGERVARFYNTALHLSLEPGEHEVTVEVSANNHSAYQVDGEAIRASATISVAEVEPSHGHDAMVEAGEPTPTVAISVTEDSKSGWNLEATLTDFAITPRDAGLANVDGAGHLHWYLNGAKQGRLYGTWHHIAELPEGEHEISVRLSTNDHSVYVHDGVPIEGVAAVSVSADQATASELGHDATDGEAMGDDQVADLGPPDVVISASLVAGIISIDNDRVEVDRDQVVAITVTSDVAEHVHLHGYDHVADVAAGGSTTLTFAADIPGVFEVEFEGSGTLIVEVEVS